MKKILANSLFIILLSGCASTTVYAPNGRRILYTQADVDKIDLQTQGVRFKATNLRHSPATQAGGQAASSVITSGVPAATGILSGILPFFKP